ncbi:sigma-70 family RNA polymerase sigma factor [Amycolatopsis pigmentata]|uniref:Sigma-70 family RNA polymerase sigma factor n=1 Tax=Amycolatopsis pigmentata TaxID=450801 RepID=A0ABW5FVV6_9PSEU
MEDDEITRSAFDAACGDLRAAERFVEATRRQVHRLLTYLSSPGVAEDLTQETYLRAFSALPSYEGRAPARMWLLSIAKRVAADHLRSLRRTPPAGQAGDWSTIAERDGEHTPDHGRVVVLRQLIAELEPERRDAFVLTQVIGLSYADAAAVCDCAVGTIRSRVFRAREDLALAMRADGGQASYG